MLDEKPPFEELPQLVQPVEEQRLAVPFWTLSDLAVLFLLAVPCLLAGLAVTTLLLRAAGSSNLGLHVLPAEFLAYAVWFLLVAALFRWRYGQPFWRSMAWQIPEGAGGRALLAGVGLAFLVGLSGVLLQTPPLEGPMRLLLEDPLSTALLGIAAVSIGPVCEELAFRGLLMPVLVQKLGPAPGIILSALPFALLHGPQYGWLWQPILLITAAGCGFGWMRYRTGSTGAAALMHAAYNATFFTAYLAGRGRLEQI